MAQATAGRIDFFADSRAQEAAAIGYAIGKGLAQPAGDVGRPDYTKRTFGEDRFEIPSINSWGHPVPLVAGKRQKPAETVSPKVLSTLFTSTQDAIEIDMKDAYPVAHLAALVRTMEYVRDPASSVTVKDAFQFAAGRKDRFETAITTRGTWSRKGANTLVLTDDAESLIVNIQASGAWELIPAHTNVDGLPFTRLGIRLNSDANKGHIAVTYTGAP